MQIKNHPFINFDWWNEIANNSSSFINMYGGTEDKHNIIMTTQTLVFSFIQTINQTKNLSKWTWMISVPL